MKVFWIILAVVVVGLATFVLVNYLLQRQRQKRADRQGVVVYATVLSIDAMGGLAKHAQMKKILLRIQEPGTTAGREVSLRTRVAAGQKLARGMKLAVSIDPKNPKFVYPASPEAVKRVVLTGSRQERRQMKAQGF